MRLTSTQEKVLKALQGCALTWEGIKKSAKVGDDLLGTSLATLLDLRKVWTIERDGIRVYGIERRVGLVPRFPFEERRRNVESR